MIAPEKRLGREVRERRHPSRSRDVTGLVEVVGQPVPRDVGGEHAHPHGGEHEPGEGEPRGLERRRRVAARKADRIPDEAHQRGEAPSPNGGGRGENQDQRGAAEKARLAEQQNQQPGASEPRRKDRRQVPALRVGAAQEPGDGVAQEDGRQENRGRGAERRQVAGENDENRGDPGHDDGRCGGPLPEAEPEKEKRGGGRSGGGGEDRRRVARGELQEVAVGERGPAQEQQKTGQDDEGGPESPQPPRL